MNRWIIAQFVALSFFGVSLLAIAAGPPPRGGDAPMANPSMGRQQVMPTIPH
jgi:hypothetical protein